MMKLGQLDRRRNFTGRTPTRSTKLFNETYAVLVRAGTDRRCPIDQLFAVEHIDYAAAGSRGF